MKYIDPTTHVSLKVNFDKIVGYKILRFKFGYAIHAVYIPKYLIAFQIINLIR